MDAMYLLQSTFLAGSTLHFVFWAFTRRRHFFVLFVGSIALYWITFFAARA